MFFIILLDAFLAYGIRTWLCLETNVRKARLLGVHVVRTPFDVNGHAWLVLHPLVWKLLACIPVSWSSYPDNIRFSHRNWNFLEKSRPTSQFGPVWALVWPGGVHPYISNPDAIEDVLSRSREFVRPVQKYSASPRLE